MKDDELIHAVAEGARRDRERERLERWESIARGEATSEERALLGALAEADGDADALRAMAPLDVTSSVMARLDAKRRTSAGRRWGSVIAMGGALAMAASIALFLKRGADDAPTLPSYVLTATGGEMASRGAAEGPVAPLVLGKHSQLSITLRPTEDVASRIEVRTALVRGGQAEPWAPPIAVSASGVVTIEGDAEQLIPGPNGPCSLVVLVGGEKLPKGATDIANAASDARLVARRVEVILKDR